MSRRKKEKGSTSNKTAAVYKEEHGKEITQKREMLKQN